MMGGINLSFIIYHLSFYFLTFACGKKISILNLNN